MAATWIYSVPRSVLLSIGLLLFITACDKNPARSQDAMDVKEKAETDTGIAGALNGELSLSQRDTIAKLKKEVKDLKSQNERLRKESNGLKEEIKELKKEIGGGGINFLLGLLFFGGLIGAAYYFRNSIRRAYQQLNGIDHSSGDAESAAPNRQPNNQKKAEPIKTTDKSPSPVANKVEPKPEEVKTPPHTKPADPTPSSSTFNAPASAPEKVVTTEITTEWEEVRQKPDPEEATPAREAMIRYSYGAINGMLESFDANDFDERTIFEIKLAQDGQTATYTVVNNERQQRNVLENQAAHSEAVEYRGGDEGGYASARVQPGTLQLVGDRWRIVDRLIIDRT